MSAARLARRGQVRLDMPPFGTSPRNQCKLKFMMTYQPVWEDVNLYTVYMYVLCM